MLLFYLSGVPLKVLKQVRKALDGKFQKMQKLTFDDQIVFFYHKCKCNSTFNSLAVHYDLPPSYLSSAFDNVERILFDHASKNIWWLSRQENQGTMPESMKKNYPNHAATFDCFEVATEIPSKVAHSVLAYSHYKSGFTIKVLGATSAAGVFMFMSEGKCFKYVTKTCANLTTYCRKPESYNGTIISEIAIMKNSSPINLNLGQT